MMVINILKICFCIVIVGQQLVENTKISYNQPKLHPCAQWDPNGITFADREVVGAKPLSLFVNKNNTIYVADYFNGRVHELREESISATRSAFNSLLKPWGLFVSIDGDIYVDNGDKGKVEKWAVNATKSIVVMNISSYCSGLFVDIDNYLYCSLEAQHRVVKQSLNSGTNTIIPVAGNGTPGATSNMLRQPYGIFVDINFDLYVADCVNDRVQLFHSGELNGTTVAGKSATPSFELNCPAAIFLDNDGYLFIVDDENNRIIGSGPSGFHCVVGCLRSRGAAPDQLYYPTAAAFDTYGNIFVADKNNHRIQKFILINNSIPSSSVPPLHSSELTANSQMYSRIACEESKYYYEAIQISVVETGCYNFDSNSNIDTYGYIYKDNFNLLDSSLNLIAHNDDDSSNNTQFKLITYLQANNTYLLVVTTYSPNMMGTFSILVSGQNNLSFERTTIPSLVQSLYSSELTVDSQKYARTTCEESEYYYEAIELKAIESGYYSLNSNSSINTVGYIYKNYFNPFDPSENLLSENDDSCRGNHFQLIPYLHVNTTYVLVVTTYYPTMTGIFEIVALGSQNISLKTIKITSVVQSIYSSNLTMNSQMYYRTCDKSKYYYEGIQVDVTVDGLYSFSSKSNIDTYGYIYKDKFNPFNPSVNLVVEDDDDCPNGQFKFITNLQASTTYVLIVTAFSSSMTGPFSILVFGPNNVTLNRINENHRSCFIGDQCQFYIKSIGMTLDDILRDEIRQNVALNNQSFLVKMSATITMIMFVGGLISSFLSFLTFQNKDLRQIGCGLYLLASSITSFLTISMFTVKFWFAFLTQMHISLNLSILRGGCMSIEPLLKLFVYLDAWLNACVAVERALNVCKGINFNKEKSKRIARWIIIILPFCIMASIIHEPLYRDLFENQNQKNKMDEDKIDENNEERHVWCVTYYSRFVQDYNTIILFFHLLGPFVANLFSALFIIFGTARQRSMTRRKQTYREHVIEQLSEHKQLVISPLILLILSSPRLVISLLSGCINVSDNIWLYLFAYFISFTPPMLIFVVFVLPSELYRKTFKESLARRRR